MIKIHRFQFKNARSKIYSTYLLICRRLSHNVNTRDITVSLNIITYFIKMAMVAKYQHIEVC